MSAYGGPYTLPRHHGKWASLPQMRRGRTEGALVLVGLEAVEEASLPDSNRSMSEVSVPPARPLHAWAAAHPIPRAHAKHGSFY